MILYNSARALTPNLVVVSLTCEYIGDKFCYPRKQGGGPTYENLFTSLFQNRDGLFGFKGAEADKLFDALLEGGN